MRVSPSASPLGGDAEISNYLSPMTQPPSPQPGVEAPGERRGPHINEESRFFKDSSVCIPLEAQTPQANEGESSSHVPTAVAAVPALAARDLTSQTNDDKILQDNDEPIPKSNNAVKTTVNEETKALERFEFEMQYGLSSTTFTNVLHEILSDLTTYDIINNWDEKLFTGPLKSILKVVHKSWGENLCTSSSLITHSTVEEILSIGGITTTPGITKLGVVDSYLLFTKVSPHLYYKFGAKR